MKRTPLLAKHLSVSEWGGSGTVTFLDRPLKLDPQADHEQDTHETLSYDSLCAENWADLERYLPGDALKLRAFLIRERLDIDFGVFDVGWPGGETVRCTSAKQAAAALRRWYPFRNHSGEEPEPEHPKVVQLRPSSREFLNLIRSSEDSRNPGKIY